MADKGDPVYKDTIDVFYGGIADDIRVQKPEVFQMSQHLDIITNPKRLTPYRTMVADVDATTKAYLIDCMAYENSTLLGIGRKSGGIKNKVYAKPVGDPFGTWAAVATGESTTDNPFQHHCCITFHNRVYFGGVIAIDAYGQISGGTYTENAYVHDSPACQGIVTSDDLLVIPGLTDLMVKNGAGSGVTDQWSTPIAFPNNRQIRDLCEWGEFVAVAMHPGGGFNTQIGSKVFLWDKVSSDPSHVIDWGEGHLLILENLEGTLIGVSQIGFGDEGVIKQKLVVRAYTGGNEAQIIFEIEADEGSSANLSIQSNLTKVKDGNRFSFGLKIVKDGVTYCQMASIGRKTSSYPWSFTLDKLVDTGVTVTRVDCAFKLGQTYLIGFNGDGSINHTSQTAAYPTATYISQRINGSARVQDAARRRKALLMAGLMTAPLTAGQSASLYYRTDENTAWTLIRTYAYGDDATAGIVPADMGFEAGVDSTSADFSNYRELQFKALSIGGAEISGLIYAWKLAGADVAQE